jgi:hypothetical protein
LIGPNPVGSALIWWGSEANSTLSRLIGPNTVGSASETHCIDLGLRPPSAELAQKLPGPREEAPVLQKGSPAQRRNN